MPGNDVKGRGTIARLLSKGSIRGNTVEKSTLPLVNYSLHVC